MMVAHVEVLVEEPSAEAALRILLPKMLGNASFQVYPHSCKDDLLKRLPERLRGYAAWMPNDWRIVVVVDRDDDDSMIPEPTKNHRARRRASRRPTVFTTEMFPAAHRNQVRDQEGPSWDQVGTMSAQCRHQVGTKSAPSRHQVSREGFPKWKHLAQPAAISSRPASHPARFRTSTDDRSRGIATPRTAWLSLFTKIVEARVVSTRVHQRPARRGRFKTSRSPTTGALSPISASESPIWAENERRCPAM